MFVLIFSQHLYAIRITIRDGVKCQLKINSCHVFTKIIVVNIDAPVLLLNSLSPTSVNCYSRNFST